MPHEAFDSDPSAACSLRSSWTPLVLGDRSGQMASRTADLSADPSISSARRTNVNLVLAWSTARLTREPCTAVKTRPALSAGVRFLASGLATAVSYGGYNSAPFRMSLPQPVTPAPKTKTRLSNSRLAMRPMLWPECKFLASAGSTTRKRENEVAAGVSRVDRPQAACR